MLAHPLIRNRQVSVLLFAFVLLVLISTSVRSQDEPKSAAAQQSEPSAAASVPEQTAPKSNEQAESAQTKEAEQQRQRPQRPQRPRREQSGERSAAGPQQRPSAEAPAAQTEEASPAAQQQKRLEEIERKLQQLLEEVQALRAERRPQQPPREKTEVPSKFVLPESWLKTITWRSIGPANMGGRIVDLAVNEQDPNMFWVATASGGLLKTTNNGITFEHQFDHENTVSIGAVAVAPSNPQIVWVGTGENNPRNSVSYGDGVYKSTDGGKTWKHMGLHRSFQIGRIVIHPTNPDIVYVGALGRLYGPNEERGLFKTSDGGKTWQKVLYINERTGVIDVRMHPNDPETLIVATWQRQRDGYDSWPGNEVPVPDGYDRYDPVVKWGPGSGLYKTTDGGQTWKKLTEGLPTCHMGRIGLDWHRSDPNIVYAVIDCENIGKGPPPLPVFLGLVGEDVEGQARIVQVIPESPAAKAGIEVGDVLLKIGEDRVEKFDQLLDTLRRMRPGGQIRLTIRRGDEEKELSLRVAARPGSQGGAPVGVWLGVSGEDREGQAVLTRIIPGGPAARAGLQAGDIVVALDDKSIAGYGPLIEQIRSHKAGDKVRVTVQRGGEQQTFTVTLEERPGQPGGGAAAATSNAYLGVQGEDVADGARLNTVSEDSPAEKAGLRAGDVVIAIEGHPAAGYDALVDAIRSRQPGDKLKLTVLRGDQKVEIVAELGTRPGTSRTRPYGFSLGGQRPNVQDMQGAQGFDYGGVYRSDDGGETWTRVNSLNSRPMYFSQIRVDPSDPKYVYVLGVQQFRSSDGGITFTGDLGRGVHADGHALWIDPRDGRHMIIGTDGGTYVTYDRGANWDHLNHTAIGQFYHVAISPKSPYHVTGGLQDNGTWFGPSLSKRDRGPINEDWIAVGGGDGFMCRVDPDDPDLVYYTSQNGNMRRRNLRTGESAAIRPERPQGAPPYRFNWNTPFILSHHNSRIFYCAGNYVFRSLNRGDNLQIISPEITLTKRGSATALSESPLNPDVLYAGTDDGALWVTRDGGRQWLEVSRYVGLPGPRWVATIEASRFAEGRVYVCFDGHRSDDDEPYVYVSEDYGQTWRSLRGNLPWGSTRCLREDLVNENILYLGTEFGLWCSLDRGQHWNKMNTNLPTVAVHEIAQHPANGEIVAATHGRSLWICDVSVLRQLQPQHLTDQIALFEPQEVVRWVREPQRGRTNRRFVGDNPPIAAQLYFALPKRAERVSIQILDIEGNVLRELRAPNEPGLHRVAWDLRRIAGPPARSDRQPQSPPQPRQQPVRRRTESAESPPGEASETEASETEEESAPSEREQPAEQSAPPRRGGFGGGRQLPQRPVGPGTYRVVLSVDGQQWSQTLQVVADPSAPPDHIAGDYLGEEEETSDEEELEELGVWIDD